MYLENASARAHKIHIAIRNFVVSSTLTVVLDCFCNCLILIYCCWHVLPFRRLWIFFAIKPISLYSSRALSYGYRRNSLDEQILFPLRCWVMNKLWLWNYEVCAGDNDWPLFTCATRGCSQLWESSMDYFSHPFCCRRLYRVHRMDSYGFKRIGWMNNPNWNGLQIEICRYVVAIVHFAVFNMTGTLASQSPWKVFNLPPGNISSSQCSPSLRLGYLQLIFLAYADFAFLIKDLFSSMPDIIWAIFVLYIDRFMRISTI